MFLAPIKKMWWFSALLIVFTVWFVIVFSFISVLHIPDCCSSIVSIFLINHKVLQAKYCTCCQDLYIHTCSNIFSGFTLELGMPFKIRIISSALCYLYIYQYILPFTLGISYFKLGYCWEYLRVTSHFKSITKNDTIRIIGFPQDTC